MLGVSYSVSYAFSAPDRRETEQEEIMVQAASVACVVLVAALATNGVQSSSPCDDPSVANLPFWY